MEWFKDLLMELILAAIGVVLCALGSRLGAFFSRIWKEKQQDETLQKIAGVTVSAVEMMYRELNGAEKLTRALSMAGELLREKGFDMPEGKIRVYLEAALAEFKGAFEKA